MSAFGVPLRLARSHFHLIPNPFSRAQSGACLDRHDTRRCNRLREMIVVAVRLSRRPSRSTLIWWHDDSLGHDGMAAVEKRTRSEVESTFHSFCM